MGIKILNAIAGGACGLIVVAILYALLQIITALLLCNPLIWIILAIIVMIGTATLSYQMGHPIWRDESEA